MESIRIQLESLRSHHTELQPSSDFQNKFTHIISSNFHNEIIQNHIQIINCDSKVKEALLDTALKSLKLALRYFESLNETNREEYISNSIEIYNNTNSFYIVELINICLDEITFSSEHLSPFEHVFKTMKEQAKGLDFDDNSPTSSALIVKQSKNEDWFRAWMNENDLESTEVSIDNLKCLVEAILKHPNRTYDSKEISQAKKIYDKIQEKIGSIEIVYENLQSLKIDESKQFFHVISNTFHNEIIQNCADFIGCDSRRKELLITTSLKSLKLALRYFESLSEINNISDVIKSYKDLNCFYIGELINNWLNKTSPSVVNSPQDNPPTKNEIFDIASYEREQVKSEPLFREWMNKNDLESTEVSGDALNCLINAILQHATGRYDCRQFSQTKKIRDKIQVNGAIAVEDPCVQQIVTSINQKRIEKLESLIKFYFIKAEVEEGQSNKLDKVAALHDFNVGPNDGKPVFIWHQGFHYSCMIPKKNTNNTSSKTCFIQKKYFDECESEEPLLFNNNEWAIPFEGSNPSIIEQQGIHDEYTILEEPLLFNNNEWAMPFEGSDPSIIEQQGIQDEYTILEEPSLQADENLKNILSIFQKTLNDPQKSLRINQLSEEIQGITFTPSNLIKEEHDTILKFLVSLGCITCPNYFEGQENALSIFEKIIRDVWITLDKDKAGEIIMNKVVSKYTNQQDKDEAKALLKKAGTDFLSFIHNWEDTSSSNEPSFNLFDTSNAVSQKVIDLLVIGDPEAKKKFEDRSIENINKVFSQKSQESNLLEFQKWINNFTKNQLGPYGLNQFSHGLHSNRWGPHFYEMLKKSFIEDSEKSSFSQFRHLWALALLDRISENPTDVGFRMAEVTHNGMQADNFGYNMGTSDFYKKWSQNSFARSCSDIIVDMFHSLIDAVNEVDLEELKNKIEFLLQANIEEQSKFLANDSTNSDSEKLKNETIKSIIFYLKVVQCDSYQTTNSTNNVFENLLEIFQKQGTDTIPKEEQKQQAINNIKGQLEEIVQDLQKFAKNINKILQKKHGTVFGIGFNGELFDTPKVFLKKSFAETIWLGLPSSIRKEGNQFLGFLTFNAHLPNRHLINKLFSNHALTNSNFLKNFYIKHKKLAILQIQDSLESLDQKLEDVPHEKESLVNELEKNLKKQDELTFLIKDIGFGSDKVIEEIEALTDAWENWERNCRQISDFTQEECKEIYKKKCLRDSYSSIENDLKKTPLYQDLNHDSKKWFCQLSWYKVPRSIEVKVAKEELNESEMKIYNFSRELIFDACIERSLSQDYTELNLWLLKQGINPSSLLGKEQFLVNKKIKSIWQEQIEKHIQSMKKEEKSCPTAAKQTIDNPQKIKEPLSNLSLLQSVKLRKGKKTRKEDDDRTEWLITDLKIIETSFCKEKYALSSIKPQKSQKIDKDSNRKEEISYPFLNDSPKKWKIEDLKKIRESFFEGRHVSSCIEVLFARILGHECFFPIYLSSSPAKEPLMDAQGLIIKIGTNFTYDVIGPCTERCQLHAALHSYVSDLFGPQSLTILNQNLETHGKPKLVPRIPTIKEFQSLDMQNACSIL